MQIRESMNPRVEASTTEFQRPPGKYTESDAQQNDPNASDLNVRSTTGGEASSSSTHNCACGSCRLHSKELSSQGLTLRDAPNHIVRYVTESSKLYDIVKEDAKKETRGKLKAV